jgi:hypothetical protein
MSWTQLVTPDSTVKGAVGWCLSFQEDVYHTPHLYATAPNNTAQYAWSQCQYRHIDQDFPDDVAVLVWWRYQNAGHVMTRYPDGTYYGSPWQLGTTQATVSSKSEVERLYSASGKYPLTYLGWSEDLAGTRIVKQEEKYEMNDSQYQDLKSHMLYIESLQEALATNFNIKIEDVKAHVLTVEDK